MNNQYLISICIPSYNRPVEIKRLLDSIDTSHTKEVQLVICEDKAPKRLEVRNVVKEYKSNSPYDVKYIENQENYGHGKNLRECIKQADGLFVLFMGDDDVFIEGTFDSFFDFVNNHQDCGYILRSYEVVSANGESHYHRYYNGHKFFPAGLEAYTEFFTKSVSMSGYTIRKEYAMNYFVDNLDETLLFQLYLMAEVCLNYPSAYCNIPCARLVSDGVSYFGSNTKEKGLYTPGIKVTNNINFINGYFKITNFLDKKYHISSTKTIKEDLSKYSYPILATSRKFGKKEFRSDVKQLREIGLDFTFYFDLYYISLLILGKNNCDFIIRKIKKFLGRRMHL